MTTTSWGPVGEVGDAYDNALADSFVDSFKTELIADRVWRTRAQLELAVGEYISWLNHDRLHPKIARRHLARRVRGPPAGTAYDPYAVASERRC